MKTQMQLVQDALARLGEMDTGKLQDTLEKAGLLEPAPTFIFSSSTTFFSSKKEPVDVTPFTRYLISSDASSFEMSLAF
ncbi:hypothetical protein [Serratia fonticola]|uniref:hypothetical protein n=1 Tax=Serratia fonticola TaxID=47917 RepID=UPI0027EE5F77|nr:hypothetical protein [Serratia fonticola]MDQ7208527.1 hypothetical protein [Serratia fonticola]HBE9083096.1 hypothetical protein [Serratia fonticola]HBE9091272.1 hypothetical protein [Serratia fonticola]HBE9151653.1 hypothetical protein [Serratia fonticola]